MFGAIEAGGTKFICGIGTGPDDLATIRIPTTSPEATIQEADDADLKEAATKMDSFLKAQKSAKLKRVK
jgi:hypothetical protein